MYNDTFLFCRAIAHTLINKNCIICTYVHAYVYTVGHKAATVQLNNAAMHNFSIIHTYICIPQYVATYNSSKISLCLFMLLLIFYGTAQMQRCTRSTKRCLLHAQT